MSENMAEMSDADLDAMIYENPSEHEELGMGETPISPTNEVGEDDPTMEESEEQPDEAADDIDDGQSDVGDEDSEEDSTDDDQTDDSEQDTDEEEDEASEDDTNESEDKGTETDENSQTTFQPLKANGKEYPISDIGELYKLASAGVGAQQKYQAIAGYKKSIMAAEKAGVNLDEAINLMADYKENPENFVKKLLQENKIDPLDVDLEGFVANKSKDYSVSDFEVKYDEVVGEIGDSPIFPKVQELLVKGWDEASRAIFLDDPSLIRNLHEEMSPMEGSDKSMFDLVSPIAEKMKLSGDNRSDFDVYMEARKQKVAEFERIEKLKAETSTKADKKPDAKKVNEKKRRAAPTGGNSSKGNTLDFAAMSDAELDAFLDKA